MDDHWSSIHKRGRTTAAIMVRRIRWQSLVILLLVGPLPVDTLLPQHSNHRLSLHQIVRPTSSGYSSSCRTGETAETQTAAADTTSCNRKEFLAAVGAASVLLLPSVATASTDSLDTTLLGTGQWVPKRSSTSSSSFSNRLPLQRQRRRPLSPTFVTYSTRFLIRYDPNVRQWWNDLETSVSLLSDEKKEQQLGRAFGTLAKSLETALEKCPSTTSLFEQFVEQYASLGPEVERQLALLFALLPPDQQPVASLDTFCNSRAANESSSSSLSPPASPTPITETTALFRNSLTLLLTEEFRVVKEKNKNSDSYFYTVEPFLPLFEIGIGEEKESTEYATLFGPLAATPLTRDNPIYSPFTYALLGLAGSTGCALTHATVIPLDVVKTRAQTESSSSSGNLLVAASRIAQTEGPMALFLGAQATIIGYVWYGLSVYPCYAYFKRVIGLMLLPANVAMAHANEVALVAGALASVVASLGLTPLEAARIRVVADPDVYRPLGVMGTLRVIASSGEGALGSLYAGLPSLLTRQVIFGSVKFLAFEKACEVIFSAAPVLSDATWTSLIVSLAAGGFSGVLSSVVSQPADSLLTYVAKGDREMGLWDGAQTMIAEDGPGSLFRGLGSRCVWAGSIIAGQFFLYDIFRTYFGVSSDDLSQVFELHLNSQG